MEIGISTASFFGRKATEDCVEDIRALGCTVAEVFLNSWSEYEEDFVSLVKSRLGGLRIHSVHALGTQFEPELYSIGTRVRSDAEKVYGKVCRAAQILNAKYITFHGPYRMKKREYIINYPSFGARTQELCEEAARYSLGLSYENVHYAYFNNPQFFASLIKYAPSLYATLDIKQAMQGGTNIDELINVTQGRLSTVHVCGADEDNNTSLPGESSAYDYRRLFERLRSTGYNNPVMLEVYTKDYKDLGELKASYEYLRKM